MLARRGSPISLQAVKLIIQNVESRSYVIKGERNRIRTGRGDLSISGPILLGYAATSENIAKGSLRVNCGHYGNGNRAYLKPFNLASGEMGLMMLGDRTEHKKVKLPETNIMIFLSIVRSTVMKMGRKSHVISRSFWGRMRRIIIPYTKYYL